jgi:hypothetical protein
MHPLELSPKDANKRTDSVNEMINIRYYEKRRF